MNRRAFITLGGAAAAWPIAARAQQKQIPRLCFLTFDPGTLRTRSPRFDGFFQGLQDFGYVNARNIEPASYCRFSTRCAIADDTRSSGLGRCWGSHVLCGKFPGTCSDAPPGWWTRFCAG